MYYENRTLGRSWLRRRRRVRSYAPTALNWMELILMEYRHARCLFCVTGKETQVVRLIQEKGWGRAIFPQRIKTVLKDGSWINTADPLLPGYVFVYSNEDEDQPAEFLCLGPVIRVLAYGDKSEMLKGRDLEFADWIWGLQGKISVMKAVQVNGRIKIIDGIFK